MRAFHVAFAGAICLAVSLSAATGQDIWQPTDGWYTLHHDAMRSGRTEHSPGVPFEYVWHHKFFEGLLSPEIEPIVAEDKVFLGTWGGEFHALDAWTGEPAWSFKATGGVRHAASYDAGSIYYATIGDRTGGAVVCRAVSDGELVWEFRPGTRGGFATSPLLYDGRLYIGGRDGVLYCLDAKTGDKVWTFDKAGGIYLQTCSARDGKVVVAAEDMLPRCFDAADGKLLWEGPKMEGDSVRFYYPVFWKDTVIFRTPAPDSEINVYQSVITQASPEGRKWLEILSTEGWTDTFWQYKAIKQKAITPEKYQAEQEYVRDAIKTGQLQRTFYMLNVADGKEKILTAVGYSGSENGYSTPTPAPVDADGNLYVLFKTVYSLYEAPIRQFDCIGTLDYQTGLPAILPKDVMTDTSVFPITSDEANNFIVGGDKLYDTHDHVFAYYDMKSRKVIPAFSSHAPETWGGVLLCVPWGALEVKSHPLLHLESPTAHLSINNEWNGTSRGAVAIYKDHVWWTTGSMIVCLKGQSE